MPDKRPDLVTPYEFLLRGFLKGYSPDDKYKIEINITADDPLDAVALAAHCRILIESLDLVVECYIIP